jgi:hypothetical protein
MDNVERWLALKGSRQRRLAEDDLLLLLLALRSLRDRDGAEEGAEQQVRITRLLTEKIT